MVDKDTGKVSVELRCGPFPSQSPSYPIQWQVKNKDVLFIIAISKSLFCFVKFSFRDISFYYSWINLFWRCNIFSMRGKIIDYSLFSWRMEPC